MGLFKRNRSLQLKEGHFVVEFGNKVYEIPYDSKEVEYAVHEYATVLGRSRLFDYFNDRLIAIHIKDGSKPLSIALDNTKYEWKDECEKQVTRYSYRPMLLVNLETWAALMEKIAIKCYGEKEH